MGDPKHTEASELNMAMETGGRERERETSKQTSVCWHVLAWSFPLARVTRDGFAAVGGSCETGVG